jgi:hypothetical protein
MFDIYEIFSRILDWAFVCKTMMIVGSKNSRLSMHFQNESKILINMIFFLFGLESSFDYMCYENNLTLLKC